LAELEAADITVMNVGEETAVIVGIKVEESAAEVIEIIEVLDVLEVNDRPNVLEVLRVLEMLGVLVEFGAAAGPTENTKVTIEQAGRVALKTLPLRDTGRLAGDETELSMWYAVTEASEMPPRETGSTEAPVFMATTTIVPSAFSKAAVLIVVVDPEAATRTASGLI
jgi:hypothetical protein